MASFEQLFGNFGNKVETLKQLFDTFIGNFLGIYQQFGLPHCLLNKLQRVQKACVRLILENRNFVM